MIRFVQIQNAKCKSQNYNSKFKILKIILDFTFSFWILIFGF